ncbi:DNA (cytosine-5-)-methyltransferase [Candidatus Pacearchaeota archaeon]|nr:DNA (cytosine-5-)-methyltransferase [Candidatus Pacearchaeota archaeon]|tara:strand:- start:966 stop:1991 length:1026 start_codon:yes stop_codon:yes gene_type:complete
MKEIRFIDLFAGIGGFRIALEESGAKCVFSSEWDKQAQKTYQDNFGEMPQGDITKIKESEIPDHDILCGGFPCQAFSISGNQNGFEDTRGTLFFDIVRIAKYHRPKVLFLENVKNLQRHNHGDTLRIILRILDEIGYTVFYKILVASNYGVPQARERIYFVAFRKDLGINSFDFPKPTNRAIYVKDILEDDIKTQKYVVKREDVKFWKKDESHCLKPIQIGQINNGGQGERIYSINGHAITLSAYGGGVAGKTGAYLVNDKIRRLSPRECARVQGFPEWFKIEVSRAQAYKQFGNSVSVPVIGAIFKEILYTLKNKDKLDKNININRITYDYSTQTRLIEA